MRDYENTSCYVSFRYCRYCGAELEPDESRQYSVYRIRPRWSTRMLGWFGGLKGDWWKGESMADGTVSKEEFSQMVREFLLVSPKHEMIFARTQRVAIGTIRGWAEDRAPHPLGIPTHVDFMREHMRSCVCER